MSHSTSGTGSDAAAGSSHRAARRSLFRVLGIVCMGSAVVLIGLAFADFYAGFSDFGSSAAFDPTGTEELVPGGSRAWMFFVAVPFFVTGGFFLNLGFSGATATYMAGEYSPAIQSMARDLGLRGDAAAGAPVAGPYCRSCGTRNDQDARFCDSCGSAMGT